MSPAWMGLPSSFAEPLLMSSRPVSIFIVVLLPQPLLPRKPKISPRWMRKLTSFTAVKLPKRRVRCSASITGAAPVSRHGAMRSGPPAGRFSGGSRAT